MLIINAQIKTITNGDIENGYLIVQDGKIFKLGEMKDLPCIEHEKVIDAKGQMLVPGFVDAHSHIGLFEDGLGFEGDDANEDTDPATPHLRVVDAVNPMDRNFSEALAFGITTVVVIPGSANPIAGQACAMKTYGRKIDDMLLQQPFAIKFALGENPKTSYHARAQQPITRMATAAIIREQLYKAKKYLQLLDDSKEDEEIDEPEYDAKCQALVPLLKGEIKAHFHAHRADDMFTAIRIAKEFQLQWVLVHATEGHLIADLLAEEQASVICGPIIGARTKPELARQTTENPGILARSGVRVAISTDHPEIPQTYLAMSAGIAVRDGMDYEQALRSITQTPAEICGLEHRIGSLEAGKDADLLLFDCDPLLGKKPVMVILNGEIRLSQVDMLS